MWKKKKFLILHSDDDLEEERRLFYVGVTRGISFVSISYANSRKRFGIPF